MTVLAQPPDLTLDSYDELSSYYDDFTAGYAHDAWIAAIESRARVFGLRGDRALDLACGTGNSTRPLLEGGYRVVACDGSPGMIARARAKLPELADRFHVADLRALPTFGCFDLVLCLDDALNYLVDDEALHSAFEGVARNLARGGIFAFDLNTLATYGGAFRECAVRERDGLFFSWRGEGGEPVGEGEHASATIEVFCERDDGLWERHTSRHRQRHHPEPLVRELLTDAGLECIAVAGQLAGGRLERRPDERRHIKFVYFARHASANHEEVSALQIISPR